MWTGNGMLGMRGEGSMHVIWNQAFESGQVIKHDPSEWFSLLHGWKRIMHGDGLLSVDWKSEGGERLPCLRVLGGANEGHKGVMI